MSFCLDFFQFSGPLCSKRKLFYYIPFFPQVDDVLRMIDYKTEELDNIFKEFNVLHTEGVDPSFIKGMGHETIVILWLTGINVFQALLIILIVSLCFNQKQKYKRRLKAATIGKKHACP